MGWVRCGLGTPSEVLSLPTPSEASGAIARFNTDLTENLLSAVAEFSASQASGTPTPSTPIPIVGVDKVNVTLRSGKNLFDKTMTLENGNIQADGSIGSVAYYSHTDYIRVEASTTYTTSGTVAGGSGRNAIAYYDINKNFLSRYLPSSAGGHTFTTPSGTAFIRMNLYQPNVDTIQLEQGSTATTYEPYNGTTAIINLGGTYYGGEVDAVMGKITLTHKIVQITQVGDKNGAWDAEQGKGAFWYASSTQCPWLNDWDNSATNNGIKVDKYTLQSNTTTSTSTNAMTVFTSKIIRWVDVDRMTLSKEDYNTYLANNPITILYPLATPIVVYASNTAEIPTIVGDNQVFADTGDVAVKFFETVGHKI